MIELAGLLYGIAKDLKQLIEYKEEDKLVDINWPEKSGFANEWRQKGYELRWSRPDRIESKRLDGWEILYEVDKVARIKRRLVLRDGMILIGKLNS